MKKCRLLATMQHETVSSIDKEDEPSEGGIVSENFTVDQLDVQKLFSYHDDLLEKYPFLKTSMSQLFSLHHRRKQSLKSTSLQWKSWVVLYKCFLLEVMLRSKNAKAKFRVPMLLGIVSIYSKVPDPVWNVLRMLRVLLLRKTVETFIMSQPVKELPVDNVVLLLFDNCDFYRHVANTCLDHRSTMIHLATQFVANFGAPVFVPVNEIWFPIQKVPFVNFMHCDYDFANTTVTNAFKGANSISKHSWLKLAHVEGVCTLQKSDYIILDPLLNCNTATYQDVQVVLANFWDKYMKTTDHTFAFVFVDQACFARVWGLKKQYPRKYSWVIPIPGEWHWSWHILQGIFKIWGTTVLFPLSRILNFSNLDLKA